MFNWDIKMSINIVNKHEPREYTCMSSNGGVVLCDAKEGAFLVLRYSSDLEKLKDLLNKIEIIE